MSREEELRIELEKVTRERDLFRRALQKFMAKDVADGGDAKRLLEEVAAAERDNISLVEVIDDIKRRYGLAS